MLPLPKPRVPQRPSSAQAASTTPTKTTDVRGNVLSSLLHQSAPPGAARLLESSKPKTPAVEEDDELFESGTVFRGPSLRSHEAIGRRQKTAYEIIATGPGAVDVCIESMKQGERPVIVVSRTNDVTAMGGFGENGDVPAVGMAVAAIASEPHAAVQPFPPLSLDQALRLLGPSANPKTFPLYVHLCDPQHWTPPVSRQNGLPASSRSFPTRLKLQQVLVATNRRPIVENGAARFATTLDDVEPCEDDSGLYWGLATVGVDASHDWDQPCGDVAVFKFVGWEPQTRGDAVRRLRDAASVDGDCFVYVHGFNTNLQFAARTAALYSRAFRRKLVVCFAWPSNPPLPKTWAISAVLSVAERNYTAAEQMLQRSVVALVALAKIARDALPSNCKLFWKGHSMGCYLTLSAIDRYLQHHAPTEPQRMDAPLPTVPRASSAGSLAAAERRVPDTFCRVILDAPDTPTWFFVDCLKRASEADVRFLHLFNPHDEAVELARQRRGLPFPAPGNGPVSYGQLGVQSVDCSNAKTSYGNHDYGRLDHNCLVDQRDFLASVLPENRNLMHIDDKPGLWAIPPR